MNNTLVKLMVLALVLFSGQTALAKNYAGKKILYIDSYHAGFEWSDGIANGVTSVVQKTEAEFKIIHMDTKRNSDQAFMEAAALRAKAEIERFKPDVVIASDDNASKYLIAPFYRNSDLPVVFCGVNWDASVYGFPARNVTGMVEVTLVPQIVQYLKKYTKGERIGFIAADRLSARKEHQYHQEILGIKYGSAYFASNFEQWRQMFLKLQQEVDMVVILNHVGIADWNKAQAIEFVENSIRIPVGARNGWDMPYSLIGVVNIPDEQGAWAAQAALKILEGVPPSKIPMTRNNKGRLFFNPRLGRKLGITTPPPFARLSE